MEVPALSVGSGVWNSSSSNESLSGVGPIPLLIDLVTLAMRASVRSESGSSMLSLCSCSALMK